MNRKLLFAGLAALVALVIGVNASDGEIDLPAWTNIDGIDVPFVGDTDVLDCKLSNPSGVTVQLELVDGDSALYPDFEHVWWNGNLVEPADVSTIGVGLFEVQAEPGEQFFAVSTLPDREDRTFCESIVIG